MSFTIGVSTSTVLFDAVMYAAGRDHGSDQGPKILVTGARTELRHDRCEGHGGGLDDTRDANDLGVTSNTSAVALGDGRDGDTEDLGGGRGDSREGAEGEGGEGGEGLEGEHFEMSVGVLGAVCWGAGGYGGLGAGLEGEDAGSGSAALGRGMHGLYRVPPMPTTSLLPPTYVFFCRMVGLRAEEAQD